MPGADAGIPETMGFVTKPQIALEQIRATCAAGLPHGVVPHDTFAGYGLAWGNLSNTPWRGMKLSAYEGGIRTPLIACWPNGIAARGQTTDQVGHVIDLLPTFLDVAQGTYPTELPGRRPLPPDGKSLLPVLQGKQRQAHDALFWRVPQHRAVRVGDWMLLRGNEQAAWELYDLARDATQTRDRAAEQPEVVHRLSERWQRWAEETGLKR